MLEVIKRLLLKIIDNIDTGNSNISEDEAIEMIQHLKDFTDTGRYLSKYSACKYLNVSRTVFDTYVREGRLPKGLHEVGFKELSWKKSDLDNFIRISKGNH